MQQFVRDRENPFKAINHHRRLYRHPAPLVNAFVRAYARRIYIATDADDAGRKFAATLAELFGDRAIVLPSFKQFKGLAQIKDVNELLQTHPRDGRDIFARLVRYAATHS